MGEQLRVLDTSVVVAWFFLDEPDRRPAIKLRQVLEQEPTRFVVPPLFHAEFVHVMARKSGNDPSFVASGFELVLRLGLRTVALPKGAMQRTVHWACSGLSGYDATFVALAEELGGVWTTSDRSAVKRAGDHAEVLAERWG